MQDFSEIFSTKKLETLQKLQVLNHEVSQSLEKNSDALKSLSGIIDATKATTPLGRLDGKVISVSGLSATVSGMAGFTGIGDRINITSLNGRIIDAEIVSFQGQNAVVMAYDTLEGIGSGCLVSFPLYAQEERRILAGGMLQINNSWLGRVLDPIGRPLDGKGDILPGGKPQKLHASPPEAARRARLGPRIDLGVKAMNLFTTCRQGQRLGLFAGSGVGKSTLLGMLARNTACDITVISLVGERGREVREFIEDDLGPKGLEKAVVIVATSDTSALMRREAAYAALAVSEYFRDQGKSVLLLMDSVTRFCQALREIGLSSGEPPATRGYPPSVFATLPRLLERAGPGLMREDQEPSGQITALFSVLVEGDDQNEPVTDAVRGILDGHIVMDRDIADAGRYPAINVLKSLSRSVPGCNKPEENTLIRKARTLLATWNDLKDLVRLGAYKAGSDPQADRAIKFGPVIETLITQNKNENISLEEVFKELKQILKHVT